MKSDREIEQSLRDLSWKTPPDVDRQVLDDGMRALDQAFRRRRLLSVVRLAALIAAFFLAVALADVYFRARPRNPARQAPPAVARRTPANEKNGGPLALSLARLSAMSNDPERLLRYLDSHGRSLCATEATMTALTKSNAVWN